MFRRVLGRLLFLVGLVYNASAEQDQQAQESCSAEGVCFPNEDAMQRYYEPGQTVDISFGESQQVAGNNWKETLDIVLKAKEYIADAEHNATLANVHKECKCRNKLCSFWAAIGECEKNPAYMLLQCAPSCQTCHQLDFDYRCPFDKDAPTIWNPGDLNKMFERLTTDEYYVERYEPNILSQPPDGPWIITLENVASSEECKRMIDLGSEQGYERSMDVGKKKFDGTFEAFENKQRTSTNAWCVDECYNNSQHQDVLMRVENITGVPEQNSEYWQFLQYHETQFYGRHHDYIGHHTKRTQGVRILTVFLYLNDVEEGGGTFFSDLGITVEPKEGRALLWPSVRDQQPNLMDARTHHEALPVKKGIKYGANAWVHQRNFKTPYADKCT